MQIWNTVPKYEERQTWPFSNEQAVKTNDEETEPQALRFWTATLNVRTHVLFCLLIKSDTVKRYGPTIFFHIIS